MVGTDCVLTSSREVSPTSLILHVVLVWGHAVSRPGKRVQVPGATQPVFSFTSLLGPLWVGGFVLLPSVPPPCPFFCLLQSSFEAMCVHKIIGEPVGCPCSKPSALPCSVVARAGNRCCCCGWAENTGLAFCFSALRANSVFRSSKNFLFWSIPLKGSRLSAGSFQVQSYQRTPASPCHLLVVRYQHVKAKPLLWD